MPISYSDIDTFMELIDEKLLEFFLERHGTIAGGRRTPSIPPVNIHDVIQDLSERTEEEFQHLTEYSEGTKSLSVSSAPQVVCYAIDAATAGDLSFSLATLRRLKSKIVSYEQDSITIKVGAYLSPARNAHSGMIAEPEADEVFPTDNSPEAREKRDGFRNDMETMLKTFDPEAICDYFDYAEDIIKMHNDLKTGLGMFRMVEEAAFGWCLTPREREDHPDLLDKFGRVQYGYAKLVISLEELKMRLSNVKRKNEGILTHIFRDDYAESVEAESWLLASILEDTGRESSLDDLLSAEGGIASTLKGIALQGPKHLDMVRRYIDLFINKIHTEVFGESKAVVEYRPVKGYIIIEEPRQRAVCTREQLSRMGFRDDQVSEFSDVAEGKSAVGMLTQYTILESPPKEYEGMPPEGFRPGDGKVYVAKRVKVIDLYRDRDAVPEELREGITSKDPSTDRIFMKLLSEARIPSSFYQVSIAYLAVMQKERVLRESIMKDDEGKPAIQVRLKSGDLGAHDELKRFMDENSYSHRMTLEELAERVSR